MSRRPFALIAVITVAAPLFLPRGAVGARLGVWRDRIFVRGALADVGIVIVFVFMSIVRMILGGR